MRFIPRKTKVKMEFFRGITLGDIILATIGVGFIILLATSTGIDGTLRLYIGISWTAIIAALFMPIADGMRLYATLGILFKFMAYQKKYSKHPMRKHKEIKELVPYVNIINDRMIDYKDYYAEVIEIRPVEFGLLNDYKQEQIMRTFANAIRRLTLGQSASIVKITKPMVLDGYVYNEDKKFDAIMELVSSDEMRKDEAEARSRVFEARMQHIEELNRGDKIYKDFFYIVIYDNDREALDNAAEGMIKSMRQGVVPIFAERLNAKGLAAFLRANYSKDFDERDLDVTPIKDYVKWTMPEQVSFKVGRTIVDKQEYRNFTIMDYPINVPNAWAWPFFSLDRTKVVVHFTPLPRAQSERNIDRSIMEVESKLKSIFKTSKQIDLNTQLETLNQLLTELKVGNEELFDVNVHITCEGDVKKEVRAILRQQGFKYSEMFGRQVSAFVGGGMSRYDPVNDFKRSIQTSSIAAMFPFISNALQDPGGFYTGYNSYPVFVDFFRRDSERVNSNMIVIGKSGSGKSYATKVVLANLAADNTKILIIDPEEEYKRLALNMKGKIIDVGTSRDGILNPFHVMTSLESDEGGGGDSFAMHLQFLEEFFKVILEGMGPDAFEMLNALVAEVYKRKNMGSGTNFKKLKPEDFPVFDDLYNLILENAGKQKDEYLSRIYQIMINYIQKFASGGRNSNLWNGPTSIETQENFVCFNFRSLLVNRNQTIANAQMLLVFKYLDNEILKNRDFNLKYETNRKIVVAVDEAHLFINPKFPIALDFMAQMAKRIRKYSGMQIVITQNIKDFVGSPEMERQSSAVINASQYSMIFSLAPNDISDLINLYRNSGEINQDEQDAIVTAGVGECFFISSPLSRTSFMVEASEAVIEVAALGK
ncbi:MAG: DUF87 domain-containing protein [Firmicutes bacterium]|nr:DUF87 domain-containing protein [Bacillota bacterium]